MLGIEEVIHGAVGEKIAVDLVNQKVDGISSGGHDRVDFLTSLEYP